MMLAVSSLPWTARPERGRPGVCGRFTLSAPSDELAAIFELEGEIAASPRYNIAPTQQVLAVRVPQANAPRQPCLLRWGLVPAWARDLEMSARLINARAETVFEKPSFRDAFKQRRCLVLADGFYEWQKAGKRKQPYYFQMSNKRPFALAGLWERWEKGDAPVESCTLITTAANATVRPVHDRMPVILEPGDYDAWLDPSNRDVEVVRALLRAYPADAMRAAPVGLGVNNPKKDDPSCVAPLPF